MNELKEHIAHIRNLFTEELAAATTLEVVEQLRIKFLGRNGHITEVMGTLKDLSLEDKKVMGPELNALRTFAQESLIAKKELLEAQAAQAAVAQLEHFDVTAYKPDTSFGSLHPFTHLVEKLEDIFMTMGFQRVDGPEVETEAHNFDGLNIPANHPARDMQDTFWLPQAHTLLRTHTSTVQIRVMKESQPPLAIFAPGRVFRHEATDATHDFMFMQCEGLLVDKNISLADLLGTIKTFMQRLFNNDQLDIRVRPSYFPFVEPGLEIDISCQFCTEGCSICKKTGWIELGGAGMVHPNVLKYCNIDPEIYSGFAFGFGIERLAMLMYGINDIRLFRSGKLDFLKQF